MNARRLGAIIMLGLLSACGGAGDPGPGGPTAAWGSSMARRSLAVESGCAPLVDWLYLVYVGRPPDLAGQAFYTAACGQPGAVPGPAALAAAYRSDPGLRLLADDIAHSAEARNQAAASDAAWVNALYRQLFGRDPDAGGSAFWRGLLAQDVSRAELPLWMLASAHPEDLRRFAVKAQLSAQFVAALQAAGMANAYRGARAAALGRSMLALVGDDPGDAPRRALIDAALASLALPAPGFAQVEAVLRARCQGCHSATPTMPGFAQAPRGIRYDTAEQMRSDAARIYVNVVQTEFMPYGNRTGMTAEERALIRDWFQDGAP